MNTWAEIALGLLAGASVGISALFPLERPSGKIVLLAASFLFGGALAALFLSAHGPLTLVGLIPSIAVSIRFRLRRRIRHNLLDAPLSPQGLVEAEVLLARMRQGRTD